MLIKLIKRIIIKVTIKQLDDELKTIAIWCKLIKLKLNLIIKYLYWLIKERKFKLN